MAILAPPTTRVGLGADASQARDRALAAANDAALGAARVSNTLLSGEMWLQQWSRGHYSALLPELRRWEVYPEGMITFDVFADSLHTLGFPAGGRWQEVENVFYSWEPDDRGRLFWQNVRAHMTGGRMVCLGKTGRNFAAGMSGGIAYVLDPDRVFADKCNMGMVELGPVEGEDIDELKGYIEKHVAATESTVGADLLADWDNSVSKFVRVMPTDYKAVLEKMKAEEALEATAA